ncbi:MAG: response regulator [Limisphaerales bacterium]
MKLLSFGRTAKGGASSLLDWEPRTKKFRLADPAPCIKPENPPQVLVVDDDPVILNTTASRLKAAGYQVATAVDGSEAISALSSQKPQFILVDINFPPDISNGGVPSWDGFRLMSWLRGLANTRDARYIVISGDDSDAARQQARKAGAVAFFPKPINHQELLSVFEKETEHGTASPRRWWTAFFDLL